MQTKSFVKISLLTFGNIINAVLGFAFITAVAKNLTLADFGKYALLTSLLVSISKIMDFGTNSVYVTQSIKKIAFIQERFLAAKVVLFFVALLVSTCALIFLNFLNIKVIFLFIFGVICYGLNFTMYAFFHKDEKFIHLFLLNFLPALIKGIYAVLIFASLVKPDLPFAFGVFSLSMVASLLLIFVTPLEHSKLTLSFAETPKLIKSSYPAGISQLINEGWPAITNTITKLFRTFADVGIFSVADKVSDVFSLVSLAIFTVLLPKNAGRKRDNLKYDLKETILLSGLILGFTVFAMFVSKFVIVTIFGTKFSESIPLLNILIFASAITAIGSFMENYFYVEEKTHYLLVINVAKLVTLLIISGVLIPIYGLFGLAYASLAASIVALLVTSLYIKKHHFASQTP